MAHEVAHILRHDYLVNLVQTLTETLLFYHPAVWWVSSRIRHERELCCDDLAVRSCGDVVCYARALTALEKMRVSALPSPWQAMADRFPIASIVSSVRSPPVHVSRLLSA